jgi:glycosyltransferase involved in cell wall biosynthesis
MRIVQIIDSLDVGGAEQMAINYANALSKEINFSAVVATRKEGDLKNKIEKGVDYLFLNKKATMDWKAVFKLKEYCKINKVQFLQPHSSSYFLAFLVKLVYPRVQIIWHDHNGLSEFLSSQKWIPLKVASFFFKGIIVVNYQLKNWAIKELNCKHVIYLPNFTNQQKAIPFETVLKGVEGKRILCLANLREQKNHFLLIRVAEKLSKTHPDWTFHLVGKDFEDEYSDKLKAFILSNQLGEKVFLYGTRNDVSSIINQSEIAILTSKSEGLPVALLEYGLNKKPVVVTQVGEIPMIIDNGKNGYVVPSDNDEQFYKSLVALIENLDLRNEFGNSLHKTIIANNSEKAIIREYLKWIKEL